MGQKWLTIYRELFVCPQSTQGAGVAGMGRWTKRAINMIFATAGSESVREMFLQELYRQLPNRERPHAINNCVRQHRKTAATLQIKWRSNFGFRGFSIASEVERSESDGDQGASY
jgi:hypothetical protein